ncbi:putative uncharacterized protein DDB_G0277255, partial [Aplysia californica]|uniref:Uncharacterized protein n=1 Tax=Aplysia californica TaxID=6500 RepID=A0ABM1A8U2_APLCA
MTFRTEVKQEPHTEGDSNTDVMKTEKSEVIETAQRHSPAPPSTHDGTTTRHRFRLLSNASPLRKNSFPSQLQPSSGLCNDEDKMAVQLDRMNSKYLDSPAADSNSVLPNAFNCHCSHTTLSSLKSRHHSSSPIEQAITPQNGVTSSSALAHCAETDEFCWANSSKDVTDFSIEEILKPSFGAKKQPEPSSIERVVTSISQPLDIRKQKKNTPQKSRPSLSISQSDLDGRKRKIPTAHRRSESPEDSKRDLCLFLFQKTQEISGSTRPETNISEHKKHNAITERSCNDVMEKSALSKDNISETSYMNFLYNQLIPNPICDANSQSLKAHLHSYLYGLGSNIFGYQSLQSLVASSRTYFSSHLPQKYPLQEQDLFSNSKTKNHIPFVELGMQHEYQMMGHFYEAKETPAGVNEVGEIQRSWRGQNHFDDVDENATETTSHFESESFDGLKMKKLCVDFINTERKIDIECDAGDGCIVNRMEYSNNNTNNNNSNDCKTHSNYNTSKKSSSSCNNNRNNNNNNKSNDNLESSNIKAGDHKPHTSKNGGNATSPQTLVPSVSDMTNTEMTTSSLSVKTSPTSTSHQCGGVKDELPTRSPNAEVKDKNRSRVFPLPAWVYCTRYSDRPSSGPRYRKPRHKAHSENDKRPRTAFSTNQLNRLKIEF